MAGCLADLFNVQGANALLDTCGAIVGRRQEPGHVGNERHHASDREHQRRILAHQRGTGNDGVILLFEELKPTPLYFGGLHLLLRVWGALGGLAKFFLALAIAIGHG